MGPFVDSKAVDSEVSGAGWLNLWRVNIENSTNDKIFKFDVENMDFNFLIGCIAFYQ